MRRHATLALAALGLLGGEAPALAEPVFLSRQYARCTSCHFSPTGGGLLTPYGRSLSREELSTFGRTPSAGSAGREHEFLFGATRDVLRPVTAGIDLRPSHLDTRSSGVHETRDFLMNAELAVAMQSGGFTLYGSVGRQP